MLTDDHVHLMHHMDHPHSMDHMHACAKLKLMPGSTARQRICLHNGISPTAHDELSVSLVITFMNGCGTMTIALRLGRRGLI